MRQNVYMKQRMAKHSPPKKKVNRLPLSTRLAQAATAVPRQAFVGVVMVVALFAFEVFNFDTTQFALENLLGQVEFVGVGWATILAIAFCAIDFAGLAHLFTPEKGKDEPKEVWYLMGAWLLGATMNALMTWWAVSLTLLDHELGNEVLSREQLLTYAPIFVAILVWLTRILFIGSLSVTGEYFFDAYRAQNQGYYEQPGRLRVGAEVASASMYTATEAVTDEIPSFLDQWDGREVTQVARSRSMERATQVAVPAPTTRGGRNSQVVHPRGQLSQGGADTGASRRNVARPTPPPPPPAPAPAQEAVRPASNNSRVNKRQTTQMPKKRQSRTTPPAPAPVEEERRPANPGRVRQRPPMPRRNGGNASSSKGGRNRLSGVEARGRK